MMRRTQAMTRTAMVLLALVVTGCDEGDESAATPKGEEPSAATTGKEDAPKMSGLDGKEVVALAEGYANAVCACKKAQCINDAGNKYHEDTNKLYADKKMRTPTPAQRKKMDAAQARVKECTNKLLKK